MAELQHAGHLEKDVEDLVPDVPRRLFWEFGLLECRNAGDEVHLVHFPDLGALDDLPAEV